MWAKERHQRILSMLATNQQVSANDLAGMLSVSRETVRRDLLDLEEAGQVNRVHGGAVLPEPCTEEPFRQRMSARIRAKKDIARKAASLIRPGQTIMVDAGTTTAIFGQELAKLTGVSVITNSLDIATTLQGAGKDVLLLGGRLATDVPATVGELTLSEIRRFRADLCFSRRWRCIRQRARSSMIFRKPRSQWPCSRSRASRLFWRTTRSWVRPAACSRGRWVPSVPLSRIAAHVRNK